MEKYCDLHTHSYYSDGTFAPEQLLQEAQRIGLAAIALTDHNTVAGLPEFLEAGKRYEVEAIPGIEITSEFEGKELHILGLYLNRESFDPIEKIMTEVRVRKSASERALVEALQQKGMDLSYDALCSATPDGNINRAHIAAAMVKKGYVSTSKEAFDTWLSEQYGLYHPAKRLEALEVIRFIKSLGGVVVLAHPFLSLEEDHLRRFLPQAKEAGLDGMENLYSKYDARTTALATQIVGEFGILSSGGSDFHGDNKPDISMGTGRGDLRVPSQVLQGLQKCANSQNKK